jgi:hypothetical protein
MRCVHCNEKQAGHDLWCSKCGRRTEVLSKDLSAMKSLNETWRKYKPVQGQNLPVGIWAALTGVLPLLAILVALHFVLRAIPQWEVILIRNLICLLFLPVLLVPFHAVCRKDNNLLSVQEFFHSFIKYSSYFLLVLISVIFYLAIYFVCKGDPILNLVWLILVFYWIAIVLPVPVLMERYQINAWKGIKLSYKKAGDVRWNIFLLVLVLSAANILAVFFLVVGLAVTLPFTWIAIRDYVDKMIEYEVFADRDTA